MYDVIVVGTGVCGAAVARELSKYQLKVLCLEKENDVADGTTKANSGIVHAGYDPEPGTKMAKLNVLGNRLIEQLAEDLDIPYQKCGSLVLAFDETDVETIQTLYERGVANGVPDLQVLSAEQVATMEPNISTEIKGALFAPTGGVVSPWELAIAQLEVAVVNGAQVLLERKVIRVQPEETGFAVTVSFRDTEETYHARAVINAAGVHADEVQRCIEEPGYHTVPNKGQYYLLDKSQGELVQRVIFQCPSKLGKGILVSPTAHGNLIVGPDSVDIEDREDVSTTAEQLAFVRQVAARTCNTINYRESIRNFSGVRSQSEYDEFLISAAKDYPTFISLANIKSPGLTASPAIALEVVQLLQEAGMELQEKENYETKRHFPRFRELSAEEKQQLIARDARYGHIICRCETITEGEIVAAVNSPIPALTVDAVKRRCNAGMGRCQGGFCSPRVMEIIARERNMNPVDVMKDKVGSYILTGKTAKGE